LLVVLEEELLDEELDEEVVDIAPPCGRAATKDSDANTATIVFLGSITTKGTTLDRKFDLFVDEIKESKSLLSKIMDHGEVQI
jgi:hypothetical protein